MQRIMKGAVAITAALLIAAPTAAFATTQQDEAPAEVCYEDSTTTEITYALQRSDWVAAVPGTPDTPASIKEGWYTEADDAAPVIDGDSLVFTAPGGQAVGLRHATNFPVSELSGTSYTDVFHDRAVVDVDGTPFGTWRDDYLSLTFTSPTTVWVAGVNVEMTLADAIATYPGTVTSFGYHMDSNAAAGSTYTVSGLVNPAVPGTPGTPEHYTDWYEVSTGQGATLPDGREDGEQFQTDALYRYVVTGEVEVPTQVEVDCPVTEPEPEPTTEPTPTPTETPVVTATPKPTSSTDTLAATGGDSGTFALLTAGALLVAGVAITAVLEIRRRRGAQQ